MNLVCRVSVVMGNYQWLLLKLVVLCSYRIASLKFDVLIADNPVEVCTWVITALKA